RSPKARIFLANTLTPLGLVKQTTEKGATDLPIVREVVQEGIHANEVKARERVLVILGNPPYKRETYNRNQFIDGLLRDFFLLDGVPLPDRNTTPLQDDYLRFLRWSVWKLMEAPDSIGHGIIAFVTNHAYVRRGLHRA